MIPSGWREIALGDVLIEHREKTTSNSQHDVLTSSRQGLILQSEYYAGENRITNRDNTGFNVIPPDYFTYRSRSDDGSFFFNRNKLGRSGCISTYYPVFRFKDSSDEFFYYLLNRNSKIYEPYSVGTSQKVLSLNALKEIKFVVPPKEEQEKIANILYIWDEAIRLVYAQIAAAKTLENQLIDSLVLNAHIVDGVSWKNTDSKVGDLIKFIGGSQPPRSVFESQSRPGYVRLLQIRDYKSDDYATYIPKEQASRWCEVDDVMIGRYGPPVFQIMRGKSGSYNVALIKAQPTGDISKDYIYYFLRNKTLFNLIDGLSRRSAGQSGVDMDALKEFSMPTPTSESEKKIVQILSTASDQVSLLEKKLTLLKLQKQGLMQQLLTGQKRVKV